jgi:CRP-like cAMP-binding protein
MQSAYFPDTAIVSILSLDASGTSIEVSLVGDDGMIGLPIVLRSNRIPYRVVVQGPGLAWKLKADVLRKEFDRCDSMHKLVLQYAHSLIVHLSQSSACNRFHTVQQRLARWLLTSQDRARSGKLQSTQESLSQMLGVNRGSASQAASALQKAGLIHYLRGQITIVNRPGLEAASCECYRIVGAEVARFFRV